MPSHFYLSLSFAHITMHHLFVAWRE